MNFFEKLIDITSGKRCLIYGAGYLGRSLFLMLEQMEIKVDYAVDRNFETARGGCNLEVKSPYDLLYEEKKGVALIVALAAENEVAHFLEGIGWEKGKDFFFLSELKYSPVAVLDPFLGYGRNYQQDGKELYGFEIYGKRDAEHKIITLGGSTTDGTLFGIRSWPLYLYELINREDICIYNGGVIGYTSSQELLKLIRDCLPLKPDMVVSYSGINEAEFLVRCGEYPMVSAYLQNILSQWNNAQPETVSWGYGMRNPQTPAEAWIEHQKLMNSICSCTGVWFLSCLQGSLFSIGEEYELSEYENKQKECCKMKTIEEQEKFYAEVDAAEALSGDIVDARDFFGKTSGLFYDTAHCNEKGNRLIAEGIYKEILKKCDF